MAKAQQQTHYHAHGATGIKGHGMVSNISIHENGKHATMQVRHRAKKPTKDGAASVYHYTDDVTNLPPMDASHAKRFTVGQKVRVTVEPDEEGDEDGGAKPMPAAKPGSRLAKNRAMLKGALKHKKS